MNSLLIQVIHNSWHFAGELSKRSSTQGSVLIVFPKPWSEGRWDRGLKLKAFLSD